MQSPKTHKSNSHICHVFLEFVIFLVRIYWQLVWECWTMLSTCQFDATKQLYCQKKLAHKCGLDSHLLDTLNYGKNEFRIQIVSFYYGKSFQRVRSHFKAKKFYSFFFKLNISMHAHNSCFSLSTYSLVTWQKQLRFWQNILFTSIIDESGWCIEKVINVWFIQAMCWW